MCKDLRSLREGKLRVSYINRKTFLPQDINSTNACFIPEDDQRKCFIGGDIRVNENSQLTVMQTVWMREHNRVADRLAKLNPKWNDETLYQESRRIVGAQLQHIIYKEFLPILLGWDFRRKYSLFLTNNGYSNSYSSDVNAGISNEFATAAYRLHSLVEGKLKLLNDRNKLIRSLELRTQFFNPEILYEKRSLESMINGLTGQPTQQGIHFSSNFSVFVVN